MRKPGTLFAQLALSAALAFPLMSLAASPGGADRNVLDSLLGAIAAGDHADFIEAGTPEFAQITPEQFGAVAEQLGPRIKAGYKAEYFGNIRQQGYDFSVWKIGFADGGDDFLATLNVSDGKVGGFLLR